MKREAFHLDSPSGRRFAILSRPDGGCRGALLYVHPFAEEMNKSRRMVALAVRDFTGHGWAVLQIDHFGCGDSCGDFGDACWQDWIDDVELGIECLKREVGAPVALWALRAGCLVAGAWLARCNAQLPLLLWHPVSNGKLHLTQFLRLKAASQMRGDAEAGQVLSELRSELNAGRSVEVGGYSLRPELADGLAESNLHLPSGYGKPISVFEVVSPDRPEPSPGNVRMVESWQQKGVVVRFATVPGPAFWQTQEIETVPGLVDASVAAIQEWHA